MLSSLGIANNEDCGGVVDVFGMPCGECESCGNSGNHVCLDVYAEFAARRNQQHVCGADLYQCSWYLVLVMTR